VIPQRTFVIAVALALMAGILIGATAKATIRTGLLPVTPLPAGASPVPTVGPLAAFLGWSEPSERPEFSTPTPTVAPPTPSPRASASPKSGARSRSGSTHSLSGKATWWDTFGPGTYAAAGPALRAAMGNYLGKRVTVCSGGICVQARLTTSCLCPNGRVIDLAKSLFAQLASPSRGVIGVEVKW
jgi:hypothetical protein